MARRSAPDALLPVRRQLRRVRWRWNSRELGRAVLWSVTLVAASTAVVVAGALRASPRAFAFVVAGGAATILAGLTLVARGARRRWLARRRTALWVDEHAGLRGRLATLVALRPADADSPFGALLVAQNQERLALWEPHLAVTALVPRRALAAAAAALGTLGLVVFLAPHLRPAAPEVVFSDQPVSLGAVSGTEEMPTRLLVAPVASAPEHARGGASSNDRNAGVAIPGRGGDQKTSALERMQEAIRSRFFGEDRPALRDAGGAGDTPPGGANGERQDAGGEMEAPGSDGKWEPVERLAAEGSTRPSPAGRSTPHSQPPRPLLEPSGAGDGGGGAGSGAGTDTDPNLLGHATDGEGGSEGFALALDAEVRARRGAAVAVPDGPPPPSLDQHPALARRQRNAAPVPRMPLPATYEPLIERLFAHDS